MKTKGFTLLEVIIYIAILSMVLLLASTFIFYFTKSNFQLIGDREVMQSARRAVEIIGYEVSSASSVYTPTTTTSQLSLETSHYLPTGETTGYIDFFLCGTRLCMKKEAQSPIFLTADSVQVSNLAFTYATINAIPSLKVNITLTYKNTFNGSQPQITLASTTALRNY